MAFKDKINSLEEFSGIKVKNTKSRYTYSKVKFYFRIMLYFVMSLFSLMLLFPLAYYLYAKNNTKYTYYDNKKLRFDGTILGSYATFMQNAFLLVAIIILVNNFQKLFLIDLITKIFTEVIARYVKESVNGLTAFFITILIFKGQFKWAQNNTHFCYDITGSTMEFRIVRAAFVAIIGKLLSIATFGIFSPVIIKIQQEFVVEREKFSYEQMEFSGTYKCSYRWFLWRYYLSIITLGLYFPIFLYKTNQWRIINTHCAK